MKASQFFSELRLYLCNEVVNKIPSHTIRQCYYKNVMKFVLGKDCAILMHVKFDTIGRFQIGKNSVINAKCRVDNRGIIIIGDNVAISQGVTILTADHDLNSSDFIGRTKHVEIKDFVWIGTNAMILPGVILEKGAAVAAGSVVTKNVNEFEIIAGIPSKKIGIRSRELGYNTKYKRLFQ